MSDSKYSRLFTERDLERLMQVAYSEGSRGFGRDGQSLLWTAANCLERYEAESERRGALTFPADEPLFLLRGQDRAAPDAISTYWEVCMGYGDPIMEEECSEAHCEAVKAAGKEFEAWQRENPDRVKVPD